MKARLIRAARSQQGFTLVELLVASIISVLVLTGLTSVVLTSWRGWQVAAGRVLASSQVRTFEFTAYDDFAQSATPATPGCGSSAATACTTQPIVLNGFRATNAVSPAVFPLQVQYVYDPVNQNVDRTVGSASPVHAATGVTSFSWYVQGLPQHQVVVITMTVFSQNYTETQTLQFYPRVG